MMTSKYIGFFLKEISAWQKTLGVVDTVTLLIIALQIHIFVMIIIFI